MHLPPHVLANHQRAILALLLSLKKKPVIRWEKMSSGGKKLAMEIQASDGPDGVDAC
jgi:vacuolar protein sorting-associated protein 45